MAPSVSRSLTSLGRVEGYHSPNLRGVQKEAKVTGAYLLLSAVIVEQDNIEEYGTKTTRGKWVILATLTLPLYLSEPRRSNGRNLIPLLAIRGKKCMACMKGTSIGTNMSVYSLHIYGTMFHEACTNEELMIFHLDMEVNEDH